jgi:hypothetical protein
MKVLPAICPSCSSQLNVKSLICERCQTEIQGQYELPLLSRLSIEDQGFVLEFIKASGSLKEMAKLLGLSYPTVRNRLDEIIEMIKFPEKGGKESKEKKL